jgi:hypothetical protein
MKTLEVISKVMTSGFEKIFEIFKEPGRLMKSPLCKYAPVFRKIKPEMRKNLKGTV